MELIKKMARVLDIDEDDSFVESLMDILRFSGFVPIRVTEHGKIMDMLISSKPDIAIVDGMSSRVDTFRLVREMKQAFPKLKMITLDPPHVMHIEPSKNIL
ncbi:hypothetical protein GF325_08660 [Candidatus Bathyarchaeota archaeon]|nr:hypothetical protein [Candidatus Bathyarchaeota archaeon]